VNTKKIIIISTVVIYFIDCTYNMILLVLI